MLKKVTNKGKVKIGGFKGFPLIDFLHPNTLKAEGIFSHPILQDAIVNHIKGFRTKSTSYNQEESSGSTATGITGIGIVGTPVGASGVVADTTVPKPSFEEKLTDFLEGLYLGNFTSNVIQPDLRRPPVQYIYEIGLNTDKNTGFIARNPYDTLITFGPRDPKYPYGPNAAIPERIAKLPLVRYATRVTDEDCTKKYFKKFNKETATTTVSRPTKAFKDDKVIKPAVVCDLNLRIIVDANNHLQSLIMYGDTLKIHLSKGLLQTVRKINAEAWAKTGKRLVLDMGNRIITLKKNRLPNWGGAIDLEGTPVSITSSGLLARLNKVNIGGTLEKPLIVFDKVEIIK